MKSVLVPSEYFLIDKARYAMPQQTGFRQYNLNKPAKYGLLNTSLNDARFPFTYQVIPYCENPVDGNGLHYLNATEDYVKHLVVLMPESFVKGKNISMNRLCTSISTSNWLLIQNITSVATPVSNCVGLSNKVKDAKNRDEF